MIKISKCLGIDLGASSVKVAQVERTSTGVNVTKLGYAALGEGADVAAIVRQLIKQAGCSAKHAVFSLYGHQVFLRELSIPRSSDDRVRRIVIYEAKQQVPFPFDEASMDYQVFDTGDPAELRVLLGAVKKTTVNEVMKVAERCGLTPVGVTVSSVALFNFYALEGTTLEGFYREQAGPKAPASGNIGAAAAKKSAGGFLGGLLGKKKKNKGAAAAAAVLDADENAPAEDFDALMNEKVVCYANIGASSVDIVIARFGKELRRLGFPRSIPEGTNMINKLLLSKFGITPEQAETAKCSEGMVLCAGDDGSTAESEGKNIEVCQLMTKWAERLSINLRKTCDYYMAQPDGAPIDEVVISGGGSALLNFTQYLEEKLGLPVSVKTELEGNTIQSKLSEPVSSFVEAVGLALDGLNLGRVTIDFLPGDLQSLRDFSRHKIEAGIVVATLCVVLAISANVGTSQTQARRLWLQRESSNIVSIREVKQQLDSAKEGRERVAKALGSVVGGLQDRLYWMDFIAFLTNATPSDVNITGMEMFSDGRVILTYETSSLESRSNFETTLSKAKEWVSGTPSSHEVSASYAPNAANMTSKSYSLEMHLKHKTTRLTDARQTILPGLLAPTETPKVEGMGGMGMGMMMPGGAPAGGGAAPAAGGGAPLL